MKKEKKAPKPVRPAVGDTLTVYGKVCRIAKVHPFGTLDVVTLDGARAWRVTGLPFL